MTELKTKNLKKNIKILFDRCFSIYTHTLMDIYLFIETQQQQHILYSFL